MTIQNKRVLTIMLVASGLLLIPLLAMQFTAEVHWTPADFLVMGVLLFGTGLLAELIWRKANSRKLRIRLIATLLILFLLVWAELAVGIFGSPLAGN